MTKSLTDKHILLVISGGIAAYKSLELIRLIKKAGGHVRCILTEGGSQFVTPLSIASLTEEEPFTDLWSLKDETEMGHIQLSREADVIIVAPASADLIAKMAQGTANDLASTTLLAANKPIIIAPAMNHAMWNNDATQANITKLTERGIHVLGPEEGDMACGEYGPGRMIEPETMLSALYDFFYDRPLKGRHAIVTSGPTHEPIDPVRFIGNRSSGKQGHAIAQALYEAGAQVTLITGPVNLPDPAGIKTVHVETACDMLAACETALPADIAVCAAAVGDWRAAEMQEHKIKKRDDKTPPSIQLQENPDILHSLSTNKSRPAIVVGFAAETQDVKKNAQDKLSRKQCDIIVANDVSGEKAFGRDQNHVMVISAEGTDEWQPMSKIAIARKLAAQIAQTINKEEHHVTRHAAE